MDSLESRAPSTRSKPQGEWFEKSNSSWSAADKNQARSHLKDHWDRIRGDMPDGVTTTEAADARERVIVEWAYKGNSPDAFLDHCTLHLRTLMYVSLREKHGVVNEDGCAEAHGHLTRWLQEDALPHDRLALITAVTDLDAGRVGAAGHIWLFCETDLWGVIRNYAPELGSAWNLLRTAFERHVRRNAAGARVRRRQTGHPPLSHVHESTEAASGGLRQSAHEEGSPIRQGDDRNDKRAQETIRFLDSWDKEIATRAEDKRKKRAVGKPSGERLQHRALVLCYRYWPWAPPLLGDEGDLGEGAEGIYKRVASEMKITEDYVRILVHRARLAVRDGLQRYPLRLEFDTDQNGWRVRLNRFAMWDTLVGLSCTPEGLAHLSASMVRIAPCDECSEAVGLTYDLPASCPTALTFPREYGPGETAKGELRLNQLLLRASANGHNVEEWITVRPQVLEADVTVLLRHEGQEHGSLPLAVRVNDTYHPLPFTLSVPSKQTQVQIELDTSNAVCRLAGVDFVPGQVVGGDTATAVITLGARVAVQSSHHTVIGLLPFVPPTALDGRLSAREGHLRSESTWRGRQGRITVEVDTNPVADKVDVEVIARLDEAVHSSSSAAAGSISGMLTLLPPVLMSLKLLDARRRQLRRMRSGSVVSGEVRFDREVVQDTEVTVSANHGGVHMESPVRVSAGQRATGVRLEVADDALAGPARVSAFANGTTLSTTADVTPNRFAVSFEPRTLIPGSVARGTITCGDSVLHDARFELCIAGEETGGPVRSASGADHNARITFSKRTVEIPAGKKEAHFEVRPQVSVRRRVTVDIVARGLGAEASGRLSLMPPPRRKSEGVADGA